MYSTTNAGVTIKAGAGVMHTGAGAVYTSGVGATNDTAGAGAMYPTTGAGVAITASAGAYVLCRWRWRSVPGGNWRRVRPQQVLTRCTRPLALALRTQQALAPCVRTHEDRWNHSQQDCADPCKDPLSPKSFLM